ncbi:MAG TPA: hypothetical protein VKT82_33265 [Ktedonobacterales bacterium]|nr:hypothetical protein [Ktedonobacterales bacterium]
MSIEGQRTCKNPGCTNPVQPATQRCLEQVEAVGGAALVEAIQGEATRSFGDGRWHGGS